MFEMFLNPWAMAAGTLLISSPIIIHLINRMRYKRIRWAAMEFLLKSQKKNRRRVIIEQIILLLLRILLVLLAGFLLARFIGAVTGSQQSTRHVVLLNDTPMPAERDLPEPLRALALCQAFELTDARFDRDVATLIEDLGGRPPSRLSGQAMTGPVRLIWLLLDAGVVVAGLAGWWLWPRAAVTPVPPPPAVVNVDVTGSWEGDVYYEWDKRTVREPFTFRFVGGQLVGSAGFLGYARGIVSGEVKGQTIAFETRSQATLNDKPIEYVHRYRGDIAGDEIRMVMQTTGPYQSGVPREFVLRRVKPGEDKSPPAKPSP